MAKPTPMAGRDILLLFLYVPGVTGRTNEPIRGRTRLTKLLFIFEKEIYSHFRFDKQIAPEDLPEFSAWKYGPFSRDVFDDVEFFQRIGFVAVEESPSGEAAVEEADEERRWQEMTQWGDAASPDEYAEFTEESFALTRTGIEFVESTGLYTGLSHSQRSVLEEYKRRFNGAPLYAILRYVYAKYPAMTVRSEIREQVV
jgi:hypothetical protein